MSRVTVLLKVPGSQASIYWGSPCCVADEFAPGILTITHEETGTVVQTFGPDDDWLRYHVYDADGYERYFGTNDVAWQAHCASRELRKAATL